MLGLVRRDSFRLASPFTPAVRRATRGETLTISLAQLFGQAPDSEFPHVNFDALERKYSDSAIVYQCVSRKAKDLARAPLVAMRKVEKNGRTALDPLEEKHPLQSLLTKVTDYDATQEWLVQITSMYMDLCGNSFWLICRKNGIPHELYPVNPLAVAIYPNRYEVRHYNETLRFRRWTATQRGDLLHFKLPNPKSDASSAFPSEWGLGPLEASWTLVITDQDTVAWNRNLVKNDGRPAGIVTTEQDVSPQEAEAAATRFRQTFGGPDRSGKMLMLGKGMKYERVAVTPQELDYAETRKMLREEIVATFDLNLAVLGFEAGDVGRRDEQIRTYWQSGIVSRSRAHILPVLNEYLAREFGDDSIVIEQDFSGVKELQENLGEQLDSAAKMWAMGVPFASVNERLSLGVPAFEGDTTSYVSASMIPAGMDPLETEPQPTPTPPTKPENAVDAGAEKIARLLSSPSPKVEVASVADLEALARAVAAERRKRRRKVTH